MWFTFRFTFNHSLKCNFFPPHFFNHNFFFDTFFVWYIFSLLPLSFNFLVFPLLTKSMHQLSWHQWNTIQLFNGFKKMNKQKPGFAKLWNRIRIIFFWFESESSSIGKEGKISIEGWHKLWKSIILKLIAISIEFSDSNPRYGF